jgi:hypothetical protein
MVEGWTSTLKCHPVVAPTVANASTLKVGRFLSGWNRWWFSICHHPPHLEKMLGVGLMLEQIPSKDTTGRFCLWHECKRWLISQVGVFILSCEENAMSTTMHNI